MPAEPLTQFSLGTPLQGYPDDGKTLAADVAILLDEYKNDSDASKLLLGAACNQVYDAVELRLGSLRKKLVALNTSPAVQDADVKLHMGPLKKLERIVQKAVHYAVCTNNQSAEPRLARVCDLLRATIEFPAVYFEKPGIGGAMIDAVNAEFKGAVVQAKNRFVEREWPPFHEYTADSVDDDLRKNIIDYVTNGLVGRDGFYRDLQLLVRLGGDEWSTGSDITHVQLEVQLVPSPMYAAKTARGADGMTGHDMYKIYRCVAEHCEYAAFTESGKKSPKLKNAWSFYPDPQSIAWRTFTQRAHEMWGLYARVMRGFEGRLANAINESDWYKAAVKK